MNKRIRQFFSMLLVSAMVFTGNVGTVFGAEEQNANLVEPEEVVMATEEEVVVTEDAKIADSKVTDVVDTESIAEKIAIDSENVSSDVVEDEIIEEDNPNVITETVSIGVDEEKFQLTYDKDTQTLTFTCLETVEENGCSIDVVEPVEVLWMYDPYYGPHDYDNDAYYQFLKNNFGSVATAKKTVKKIVTKNVKSINQYAFAKWTGIQAVEFDDALERIEFGAFLGTNLQGTVKLGKNVKYLGTASLASNSAITRMEIYSDIVEFPDVENIFANFDTQKINIKNTVFCGAKNSAAEAMARELLMDWSTGGFTFEEMDKEAVSGTCVRIEPVQGRDDVPEFMIAVANKSDGVDVIKAYSDEEWGENKADDMYCRTWVQDDENIWFRAVVADVNGKEPNYIIKAYDSESDSYKVTRLEPEFSQECSCSVWDYEQQEYVEKPATAFVYKYECEGTDPVYIDSANGYTVLFDNTKAENMYDFNVKYVDCNGKVKGYLAGLQWISSEEVVIPNWYDSYPMEIKPRTKCKLNSVKLYIDGVESNVPINTSGIANIKLTGAKLASASEVKFVVDATPLYKATTVVDEGGNKVQRNSNAYAVEPRKNYTISGIYGNEKAVDIKKIVVDDTLVTAENNGDNTWNLAVLSKAGGRTVSVKLYDSEDEGAKPVDSFSLKVNPTITGVTIKNAKKSAAVTGGYYVNQEIGTTDVAYTIVRKSAEASSKDILSVNCINTVGEFTAKMSEDGKKILVSAPIRKDAEAVVEVINVNDSTDEEPAVVGTFTVKTVAPAWVKNAPTVKAGTPSDINLNLNLTVPKGVVIPEGSDNYYYFLKATPKVRTDEDDEGPAVKIEKATGKSQTIVYKVIDEDPGEGHKATFNVSAYLIFVNDGEAPNDLDSANIAAVCKVGKLANATTYTPAYETKLALTKKTTTLYTGQEAIVAAPKYSKNTTHVDTKYLSASCVVWNYSTYEMENIASITEDGQIMVKVPAEDVTAGKYNVKVVYTADENYQSLTVNLPITIVQGILSINAVYPSKVYTKDSKVTVNPVITYNNGVSKPKSAKVTYVAYPEGDTEETPLPAGVTLNKKNGAITFSKGYEGPAINVVVKAADFKENTVVSDVCTIKPTYEKTEIGDIYLLTDLNDPTSKIEKDNINTANFLVVEDLDGIPLPEDAYTISVSGAGKYSDGRVIATKSGLMKITVTAKDGGKSSKKAEYTNYSYPVVKESIRVLNEDLDELPISEGAVNNTAAPYDGLYVELDKTMLREATLSVTGGELVYKVDFDDYERCYIIPTAAETKYTVSYKSSWAKKHPESNLLKSGKVVVTVNNIAFSTDKVVNVQRIDEEQILGGRSVSEGGYHLDYKVEGLEPLADESNESYVAYVSFKNNKVNKTHPFYNCDSTRGHIWFGYKNDTKFAPIEIIDDEFSINLKGDVYTAGTYKNNEVQIYKRTKTLVDEEEKYSYTPVSKILSLPDITVTPYKKPSMKVAGSYTITKQAEEDGFALNISSLKNVKSIDIVEDGVQNAIVGGKLGEFKNYFSISDIEFNDEVGKYVAMVSVSGITDVDENDRTIIVPKAEDLVGFITFKLTNENDQYELMQVKIQIKIKK